MWWRDPFSLMLVFPTRGLVKLVALCRRPLPHRFQSCLERSKGRAFPQHRGQVTQTSHTPLANGHEYLPAAGVAVH